MVARNEVMGDRQALFSGWMGSALDCAVDAASRGDIPIGALVANADGQVVAMAGNRREIDGDPTAHAEILALRLAAQEIGDWRLDGCTLVVTVEPCPMCAGAAVLARIATLVIGAWNDEYGAAGSRWDVVRDRRMNHRIEVIGGVRSDECAGLLTNFLDDRRATNTDDDPYSGGR